MAVARRDPRASRWAHESGMIHAKLGDLAASEEHLYLAHDFLCYAPGR
ncbi:hypothetical protein GTZ89_46150 [Streptomyces sp. SID8382]|nr:MULTISPECIES: hypothetical protein [unclassified Streptomyces]MYX62780.1 hypothetical protein [Streptomyces sp. SID8382]